MPLYIVTYDHPNEAGWAQHIRPHIAWLQDRQADGSLLASGPFSGEVLKSALQIISAPDRQTLDVLIAGDPFSIEGLIENMTVREWDPIFGAFNHLSSMSGQIQKR